MLFCCCCCCCWQCKSLSQRACEKTERERQRSQLVRNASCGTAERRSRTIYTRPKNKPADQQKMRSWPSTRRYGSDGGGGGGGKRRIEQLTQTSTSTSKPTPTPTMTCAYQLFICMRVQERQKQMEIYCGRGKAQVDNNLNAVLDLKLPCKLN